MGPDAPTLIGRIREMTDSEVRDELGSLGDLLHLSSHGMEAVRLCYVDILNTRDDVRFLGGNYCEPCASTRNKALLYALCLYSIRNPDPAKLLK